MATIAKPETTPAIYVQLVIPGDNGAGSPEQLLWSLQHVALTPARNSIQLLVG